MPAWRMPPSTMPSLRTSEGEAGEAGEAGEEAIEGTEGEGTEGEGTEGEGTEGEGFTCSVCLCDLIAGEMVRTLPCKHRFHMSCIDAWLTENSHVCPADGLPVLPDMST